MRRVLDDTLRGLVYLHSHDPPIIHRGDSMKSERDDDVWDVMMCDVMMCER